MSILELPVGSQEALKGSMCHVPIDISPTVNKSPCNLEDTDTVSIKNKVEEVIQKCILF